MSSHNPLNFHDYSELFKCPQTFEINKKAYFDNKPRPIELVTYQKAVFVVSVRPAPYPNTWQPVSPHTPHWSN